MKVYTKYKESNDIWLGKVPEHWTVSSLKHFVDIVSGYAFKSEDYSDDIGIPIIRIGDISNTVNVLNAKKANPKNLDELERFIIKRGDLLLAMTGATIGKNCMFNSDEIAYVNQRVGLLRGKGLLSQDYLKYFIDTPLFREFISLTCSGSAQENISTFQISELKFLLPSSEEQTKITQYLDYQTSIIDELISKKQALIELLKEKRQTIINETITKGLNPNAKMKDSGIEWLGEIPEEFKLIKIKSLLMSGKILQQDGNHGELHPTADDYLDSGIPFIMANNVNQGKVDLVNCKFLPIDVTDKLRIGFAKEGDILLTHKGTVGRVAIVPELSTPYIMLTPQVTYYRVLDNFLSRDYLELIFQSDFFQIQLKIFGSEGSTRSYVGLLNQRDLKVILPEYNIQIEILKKVTFQINDIDNLISLSLDQIEKLKEYRQSVISEAVTGMIDVREWIMPNIKN